MFLGNRKNIVLAFSLWSCICLMAFVHTTAFAQPDFLLQTGQSTLTTDTLQAGAKIFSDRTYVVSSSLDPSLSGMIFIRGSISGCGEFLCPAAGALYALTPAVREGAATQVSALEAAGFVLQSMPEFQLFGTDLINKVLLYKKEMSAGERFNFGKWVVLLAPSLRLEETDISPKFYLQTTHGDLAVDDFLPANLIFSDRTYVVPEIAPSELRTMRFIRGKIQGAGSFVCPQAGALYALTPGVREGAASQASALEAAGFVLQSMPEFQLFGTNEIDKVILYKKEMAAGEEFYFGKWVVYLAPGLALQVTGTPPSETLYNGISLPKYSFDRTDMTAYGADPLPVPYLNNPPQVIPVDLGRQLFVDDFLIENTSTTLTRTWHKAQKDSRNPIFKPETPQELGTRTELHSGENFAPMAAPFSGGVWYDATDRQFKMWYCAGWFDGTAYATSLDGINWNRPQLNVETGTNLVIPRIGQRDSCAVTLDPDAGPDDERYKMFLFSRPQGGELFVSKDGVNWSAPVATGGSGDRTTIFYNPFRKKWVYSLRASWSARSRNYSESSDFLGGAPFLDSVAWLRSDNLDIPNDCWFYAFPDRNPGQGGDVPELYNFDAVAYESIMLGAFCILLGPDNPSCAAEGVPKLTELHLGFSRDGFHWSRPTDRTPFIPASRTDGAWDRAYLQTNSALCLVMDEELWFFYTGFAGDPERKEMPDQSNGMYANASMGLARLRRDGFASMDAGQEEGVLTTRPIVFTEGSMLYVNAKTDQGALTAEILDENGAVIEGFSRLDCTALTTDSTCTVLSWQSGANLSALQGQTIRLRFFMRNGQLYSFWFSEENGASRGYLGGGGPRYDTLKDNTGMRQVTCVKNMALFP